MMQRAPWALGIALALAVIPVVSCSADPQAGIGAQDETANESADQATDQATDQPAEQPQWLFTVSGDLEVETDGRSEYLTLRSPTDVLAFTERPDRAQAILPVGALAAGWPIFGFDESPPNASVAVAGQVATAVAVSGPAITEDGALRLQLLDDAAVAEGPATITVDATSVNSQVTDVVTQSNVKVVGEAPAAAMATVYQSISSTLGEAVTQPGTATMSQDDAAQVNAALVMIDGQGLPGGSTPTTSSAGG